MPTTIIKSIGSGGGRDYTTAAAWEADTDNDLVAADQIQVGELYDDADFTLSADLNIGGATVDATRFRILRAVAGQEYNPLNDSGVWFRNAGSNFAITLQEANAQLKGIGIENTYTATVTTWCIRGSGVGNLIERCYGEMALHSVAGGPGKIFDTATTGVIFRNCIAVGSNGGSAGAAGCEEHDTLITTASGASHNRIYIAGNLSQLLLKTQFLLRQVPGGRRTTPPCRCAAWRVRRRRSIARQNRPLP